MVNPLKIAEELFWWHMGNLTVIGYEIASVLSQLDLRIQELTQKEE